MRYSEKEIVTENVTEEKQKRKETYLGLIGIEEASFVESTGKA